jgi:hypothetical protein
MMSFSPPLMVTLHHLVTYERPPPIARFVAAGCVLAATRTASALVAARRDSCTPAAT